MGASSTAIPIYSEGSRGEQKRPLYRSTNKVVLGCLTILTGGYLKDGADAASSVFGGVAKESATGGVSDGDVWAQVAMEGCFWFALNGGALTDLGKEVYIYDNQTVAVANPGTGIKCGVIRYLSDARRTKPKNPTANSAYTWALIRITGYC